MSQSSNKPATVSLDPRACDAVADAAAFTAAQRTWLHERPGKLVMQQTPYGTVEWHCKKHPRDGDSPMERAGIKRATVRPRSSGKHARRSGVCFWVVMIPCAAFCVGVIARWLFPAVIPGGFETFVTAHQMLLASALFAVCLVGLFEDHLERRERRRHVDIPASMDLARLVGVLIRAEHTPMEPIARAWFGDLAHPSVLPAGDRLGVVERMLEADELAQGSGLEVEVRVMLTDTTRLLLNDDQAWPHSVGALAGPIAHLRRRKEHRDMIEAAHSAGATLAAARVGHPNGEVDGLRVRSMLDVAVQPFADAVAREAQSTASPGALHDSSAECRDTEPTPEDIDLVGRLRLFADTHPGPVTISAYTRGHGLADPAAELLVARFGSWEGACKAAGIDLSRWTPAGQPRG